MKNESFSWINGNRIKELKDARHLSQKALGTKADMSQSDVSRWIREETKDPQLSTVVKMANALGVSVSDIINGETSKPPMLAEFETLDSRFLYALRKIATWNDSVKESALMLLLDTMKALGEKGKWSTN